MEYTQNSASANIQKCCIFTVKKRLMILPSTDCHCHILPGVDDGATCLAEAMLTEGLYDLIGTDLHNERYAVFFDSFGFTAG